MRLHDFKCPEGHITEELVQPDTASIKCTCGEQAIRIITPINFHLNGSDQSWPSAHSKWVREHERAGNKHL
jgi:hypothetical protein